MPICKNEKGPGYFNAAYLTHEDFAIARRSWRRAVCGDAETNDVCDPIIRQMLEVIEKNTQDTRKKMNRGDDIPILFGDKTPVESGDINIQYGNLYQIALGYGTYGCPSYHSPEVLQDIIYGLDWMEAHMYGAEVLSDTSFRSYLAFNWWDWFIGGSVPMLTTVMIIEESLSREDIDRYVLPMSFLRTQMRLGNNAEMAAGQILPCTPLALLTDDKALLQSMYLAMGKLLEKHEEGDNMRADWCCMTHGMPYNLGYGQANLDRMAFILQILAPTPLNFPLANKKNLLEMARYCFAPALYQGRGLQMLDGRAMQTSHDAFTAARLCGGLRYLIGVYGPEEDQEIFEIIHRNASSYVRKVLLGYDTNNVKPGEDPKMEFMPYVGLVGYKLYKHILLAHDIPAKPYELAYMWRSGDCCVQHHNGVCYGLRMNSERVFGYECINHENMDGWYTGDGHLYVYLPGQDKQYSIDYWKYADKYHIPGVTADTQEREVKAIVDCFAYYSDRSFVGGTALDGQYLSAAMDFRSFHNDKIFEIEDVGYGSGLPIHHCTLEGHKTWFFLDKVAVAIGTGISAHEGFEVHTTVENRLLSGNESLYVDGVQLPNADFCQTYQNVHTMCIDGLCGYVFLQTADIVVTRRTTEAGVYVSAWINHGVNPQNAGYAYALLPLTNVPATQEYANTPDLTMLSHTSGCIAVKEVSSGLCGYAFFEAGDCNGIHAVTPLIMMCNEQTGHLSVCDPTQKQENVQFSVAHVKSVTPNDDNITMDDNGIITVVTKDTHGQAFSMTL